MLITMFLLMACSDSADAPEAAPPSHSEPAAAAAPAPAPPADAAAKAPAASDNPHQLPGYEGRFKGDPKLTPTQVVGIAPAQLRTVRNEVFARYGRPFKSEDLQAHFGKTGWYQVKDDFDTSWLTANDNANVALIQSFEGDKSKDVLSRGDYHGGDGQITFVDASTAELLDGTEDMYNWERETRHWVSMGDWVVTWEGGSSSWSPDASGLSNVQLWQLDHAKGEVKSVTDVGSLQG